MLGCLQVVEIHSADVSASGNARNVQESLVSLFLDFLGLSIVSTREVFKPRVSTLYITWLLPHNLTLFVLSRLSCGNCTRVSPAGSPEIPTQVSRARVVVLIRNRLGNVVPVA